MEYREEEHKSVIFNKAVDNSDSESAKILVRNFQSETLLRPKLNESSLIKHKSVVVKISNWDINNSLINSNDSIGTEATERNSSLDAIKQENLNFHKDFRNRTNSERKKVSISDTDIIQNEPPQSSDNDRSVEPTYNGISHSQSNIESNFAKQTNRNQETNSKLNNNEAPETSKSRESKTDYKNQVNYTVAKVKLLLRAWMGIEIPKDSGSPVDNIEVVHEPDIVENSTFIKRPIEITPMSIDNKLIKNTIVNQNNDINFKTKLKLQVEKNSGLEKIQTTSEIEKEKQNDSLSRNKKDNSNQTNKNDKENTSESNTQNTISAHVSDLSLISGFRSIYEDWGRTNREACAKNSLKAINDFLNGTSNLNKLNVVLSRNSTNNENVNSNNDKNSTKSYCKFENLNSTKDSCSINKHMQSCQNNRSTYKGDTIRKDVMRSYIRQRAHLTEYTLPFQPSHIQNKDKQITQLNRKQYVSEKYDESNTNTNRNMPDNAKSQTKIALSKMIYIEPMEDLITDDFHNRVEKQFHKKS